MTDNAGDQGPHPPNGPPDDKPKTQAPAGPGEDGGEYSVSEPGVNPADLAIGETTPVWFLATPGGPREGPLSIVEMRRRIATGRLTAETLVWQGGMAGWMPAGNVPELFKAPPGSQQLPPPMPGGPPQRPAARLGDLMQPIDKLFSCPLLYRLIGRVCAVLAALTFCASVLGLIWRRTWFTQALILALVFLVCEAAGAILAALARAEEAAEAAEAPPGKADHST